MANVLQRDTLKLLEDADRIKQELKKLEKDCRNWSVEREGRDLSDLTDTVKDVETDVSLMLADSISADLHSGWEGEEGFTDELHRVFVHLDALFGDIKEARSGLHGGYVPPGILNRLEIDCRRFSKTVQGIEKDLGACRGKRYPEGEKKGKGPMEGHPEPGQGGIQLIRCRRQPGNLLISRYACGKRYLLAQADGKRIHNDVFGMVRKSSLSICRNCPEGRISAKGSERQHSSSGKKTMVVQPMRHWGSPFRNRGKFAPASGSRSERTPEFLDEAFD